MRVYIKANNGMRFFIPAPLWVLKIGLNTWIKDIIKKNLSDEQKQYIDYIDFRKLSRSIDLLKEYKGLTIVDIKAADGTFVNIRL